MLTINIIKMFENIEEVPAEIIEALKSIEFKLYLNCITNKEEIGVVSLPEILIPYCAEIKNNVYCEHSTLAKQKSELEKINYKGTWAELIKEKGNSFELPDFERFRNERIGRRKEVEEIVQEKPKKQNNLESVDTSPVFEDNVLVIDYSKLGVLLALVK